MNLKRAINVGTGAVWLTILGWLCLGAANHTFAPTKLFQVLWASGRNSPSTASVLDDSLFSRVAATGLRIGTAKAPITIVVYSSYSCSFCAKFEKTLRSVAASRPGQVSVLMKHYMPVYVRRDAVIHLGADCAADQGKFAEYNRAAFLPRGSLRRREPWRVLGDSAGIPDSTKFSACVRSEIHRDRIVKDTEEGQMLGVSGTPTSFLNGRRLIGAGSPESLLELIDSELRNRDSRRDTP